MKEKGRGEGGEGRDGEREDRERKGRKREIQDERERRTQGRERRDLTCKNKKTGTVPHACFNTPGAEAEGVL